MATNEHSTSLVRPTKLQGNCNFKPFSVLDGNICYWNSLLDTMGFFSQLTLKTSEGGEEMVTRKFGAENKRNGRRALSVINQNTVGASKPYPCAVNKRAIREWVSPSYSLMFSDESFMMLLFFA